MFTIKFDTSRFGVKGPALRIELVSKYKISGFNPRGMLQQGGRRRVAHIAVLHGLHNVEGSSVRTSSCFLLETEN